MSTISSTPVTPRRSVMIASPIPTGMHEDFDPTDAVLNANLVTSTTTSIKDWRPMSSVSQVSHPEKLLRNDQEQDHSVDEDNKNKESSNNVAVNKDNKHAKVKSKHPSTTPSSSHHLQNMNNQKRSQNPKNRHLDNNFVSHRKSLRQPCKYKPHGGPSKGQHKSFITMTQRSRTTSDGIKGTERNFFSAYGDRVCRPYSTYSVSKSCERLAISPYGGPMLPSAVGRYREHYQSRNPSYPTRLSKATRDALNSKFQKFYINQDLVAITENKKPAGVLKKPPSPQVSKQKERRQNTLHHGATERMVAVQSTLGWKPPPVVSDGKRFGVGYQVAMELSYNLDKHRRARSANVIPEVPPAYQAPQSDQARLNNQAVEYLTNGEIAIRKSVKANKFDPVKPKKEATKFYKKRPPSPPLSKLSRDKFLPEALRKREEMEKARLFSGQAGLRLGRTTKNVHDTVDDVTAQSVPPIERPMSRTSIRSEDDDGSECSELNFGDLDKDLMIRGQSAKHTPRSAKDLINSTSSYRATTTPMCSPELASRHQSAVTQKDKIPDVESDEEDNDDEETKRTQGTTSRMSGTTSRMSGTTSRMSDLTQDLDVPDAETEDVKERQATNDNSEGEREVTVEDEENPTASNNSEESVVKLNTSSGEKTSEAVQASGEKEVSKSDQLTAEEKASNPSV